MCPFGSETLKAVLEHHTETHPNIPYSNIELILDDYSGKFHYQSKHCKKKPCTFYHDSEELSTRKDDPHSTSKDEPAVKNPKYETELDELKLLLESVVPN